MVFSALAKLLPGFGSLVGAAVAAGFTWMVGQTSLRVLEQEQEFSLANLRLAFQDALPRKDRQA